jgi:hypothetical protein
MTYDVPVVYASNLSANLPDIPNVMAIAQPISSDIRITFTPLVFLP